MDQSRIQLMGSATVGAKGQIVIPVEVRDMLGIAPGDKLFIVALKDKKAIGVLPMSSMQRLVDAMGEQLDGMRSVLRDHEE